MIEAGIQPQLPSPTANDVASVTFSNAGKSALPGGVATFAQHFSQGALPAGGSVVARTLGGSGAAQLDIKTTWPDGSAKMAVVSVDRATLPPGAEIGVVLTKVAPTAPPPAINLAQAISTHSFKVDLTPQGGATQQIDVLAALNTALAQGKASFWQSGALATEARVEIDLPGSMRLVADVTAYKGGGLSVDLGFNNDQAMQAVGGRVAYTMVARLDGQEVGRETVNQGQYQNWRAEYSTTTRDGGQGLGSPTSGWLNIQHDVAKLQAIGAVPHYDLSLPINPGLLQNYAQQHTAAGFGDPLAANGVTQYMPQGGGRSDIGFVTKPNAVWLISGDAHAAAVALGQAEASNAVPWNMWDSQNKTWLNTDNYPRLWIDARGGTGRPGDPTSGGLVQQIDSQTGWTLDMAHQPALAFVPYLLTGERHLLDSMNAQAATNVMYHWPAPRGNDADNLVGYNQVRGAAWAMREIGNAAFAAPDGSAEKAYLTSVENDNWAWLVEQIPAWTAIQGEAHGRIPVAYGAPGHLQPWQQDYFAHVAITAAERGNADARTFLEWMSNFLVGRFTSEAKGFTQHDGAAYLIAGGDQVTGVNYLTWAEIGAQTAARGWSNGQGWANSNGDYVQLALSTLSGLARVLGNTDAARIYRELVEDRPPYTSAAHFGTDPAYAIAPPPGASFSEGPPIVVTPPPTEGGGGGGGTPGPNNTWVPPVPDVDLDLAPDPQTLTIGRGSDSLVLRISQDEWQQDARFTIAVNGQKIGGTYSAQAWRAAGEQDTVTIRGDWALGNHTLTVTFLNDGWAGTASTDRNLFVDGITINGLVVPQGTASLLGAGPATFTFTKTIPAVPTIGSGPDVLRLGLSGDSWRGDPRFAVLVDGVQVGPAQLAKAPHASGAVSYLDVRGDFANGKQVAVRFLNDAFGGFGADRNLYLDSMALNGVDLGRSATLLTVGDASFLVKPVPTESTPVAAIGRGADVVRLGLSQDAWNADAKFVVLVNGVQVGGTRVVTASHEAGQVEYLDVRGDFAFGAHSVKVRFVNDAWAGNPTQDRNLYVESVALNGVDLGTGASLRSNGDATFAIQGAAPQQRMMFAQSIPAEDLVEEGGAPAGAGPRARAMEADSAPQEEPPPPVVQLNTWGLHFQTEHEREAGLRDDQSTVVVALTGNDDVFTWVAPRPADGDENRLLLRLGGGDDAVLITAPRYSELDEGADTGGRNQAGERYFGHDSVAEVHLGTGRDSVTVEGWVRLIAHFGDGEGAVQGGRNDDYFDLGAGTARIATGRGEDRIAFSAGDGDVVIADFQRGADQLVFEGIDPATMRWTHVVDEGRRGVLITFDEEAGSVLLQRYAHLNAGDYTFV